MQRQRSITQARHYRVWKEPACGLVDCRTAYDRPRAVGPTSIRVSPSSPLQPQDSETMNIMKSLLAEFAPSDRNHRQHCPVQKSGPGQCPRCGGINHWQQYGNGQWYCDHCDHHRHNQWLPSGPCANNQSSVAYAVGNRCIATASVCGNRIQFKSFQAHSVCTCGSHMVVENSWSDGLVTFECVSCAAGIAAEKVQGQ